ncbi:MAG: hypothetical protein H0W76_26690 [Pyrinomonadaceae bacterium]|nr:hypothetical protein [Pyrinomonadaceae bacterium]
MLRQNSITTHLSATTAAASAAAFTSSEIRSLVEAAHEQTCIAGRIAQSFEQLDEVSFADLDAIARNCYCAGRTLEALRRMLAASEVAA